MKIHEIKDKIRESQRDQQLYATYLFKEWLVTTAYRESSAMEPSWYEETLIWRIDIETAGHRELVADATRMGHWKACQRIVNDGEWKLEEAEND
ncbi:MAG: hypothetical protein E6Q97_00935 [Desulfurellales bacterium]|nr:MAG: hypothetical protein E6Q97_00935 [Desulfurellales bacterium]